MCQRGVGASAQSATVAVPAWFGMYPCGPSFRKGAFLHAHFEKRAFWPVKHTTTTAAAFYKFLSCLAISRL